MANRIGNPVPQFFDSTGEPLAGAQLFFYITGTSTKTDTYTTAALSVANSNPLELDAAGRLPACFLDPEVTYRVILAPADDDDPPTAAIWTRDPVVDFAANVFAAFRAYSGDPNGNVAGNAGVAGGAGTSAVYDILNDILYICTTTGDASTAVWTAFGPNLTGAILETGILSPSSIGSSQDNYAPSGIGTASLLRLTSSAAYNITGISASQTDGRKLEITNIGSFIITLKDNVTSTEANRFMLNGDLPLGPDESVALKYDGTSSRWRAIGHSKRVTGQQTIWVPAAAMTPRTTNGAAGAVLEHATNDVMSSYLAFDTTTSEAAQVAILMPKGWDEGTIVAQFVWTHPATVTNFGVTWGIRAVAFANDDALDTAFGTEMEVSDTGGTTSDLYISPETSALTIAGTPGAEEYVVFEVYRDPADASDNLGVDAYLLGVKLHYSTDSATDD